LVIWLGNRATHVGSLTSTIGVLSSQAKDAVMDQANLDAFLAAERPVLSELRHLLKRTFTDMIYTEAEMDVAINVNDVYMAMPFTVGDYVDFYASENHASKLGRILRPNEEPLKPNWKHMPVSYHGRAS